MTTWTEETISSSSWTEESVGELLLTQAEEELLFQSGELILLGASNDWTQETVNNTNWVQV